MKLSSDIVTLAIGTIRPEDIGAVQKATVSQGKLEKNLKQIPYQNICVQRSCIRSGLPTQNVFTLDIHRRIFRRVKSKIADYLTEIFLGVIINHQFAYNCDD